MFAGRRFDIEIGLYYNRNRYYNPYTGRFLQTDPAGDGMNLYAYCGNNSLNRVDPTGLYWTFLDSWYVRDIFKEPKWVGKLVFAWVDDADNNEKSPDPENVKVLWTGMSFSGRAGWYAYAKRYFPTNSYEEWVKEETVGYDLSRTWVGDEASQDIFFWRLQAMRFLSGAVSDTIRGIEGFMRTTDRTVVVKKNTVPRAKYGGGPNGYDLEWKPNTVLIEWNPNYTYVGPKNDDIVPGFVSLSHELAHAWDYMKDGQMLPPPAEQDTAIALENSMRLAFYWKVPNWQGIKWERP